MLLVNNEAAGFKEGILAMFYEEDYFSDCIRRKTEAG